MKLKEFFSKLTSLYLLGHLLTMAVVVVLLCLGVWFGLRLYTHHGEGIAIPDLKGMKMGEARELLESDGLYMVVNDRRHDKSKPADCILAQLPGAGMKVKSGRTIYVTINSNESERKVIPEVIDNSSYREAQARLAAIGFKILEPKLIDGEKDWVYGIQAGGRNIINGAMVPIDQPLTLVIGRGAAAEDEELMNEQENDTDTSEDNEDDVDGFLEVTDNPDEQ